MGVRRASAGEGGRYAPVDILRARECVERRGIAPIDEKGTVREHCEKKSRRDAEKAIAPTSARAASAASPDDVALYFRRSVWGHDSPMERCVLFHPWTVTSMIMAWDQCVVGVVCITELRNIITIAGIRRILGMNCSKQTDYNKKPHRHAGHFMHPETHTERVARPAQSVN
jgi:hypothetical protein